MRLSHLTKVESVDVSPLRNPKTFIHHSHHLLGDLLDAARALPDPSVGDVLLHRLHSVASYGHFVRSSSKVRGGHLHGGPELPPGLFILPDPAPDTQRNKDFLGRLLEQLEHRRILQHALLKASDVQKYHLGKEGSERGLRS